MYIVLETMQNFYMDVYHELVNIEMLGARLKSCIKLSGVLWNSNVLDYVF